MGSNKMISNDSMAKIKDLYQETGYSSEWELRCQQRYESSQDLLTRVKTSFNIGLIFLRLI